MITQSLNSRMYIAGGALLFCVILVWGGIRYVISGEKLYLNMWFAPNVSVNISDIASAERSYNPISSPASSFKRLKIKSVKGCWLISPVRENEFVEALKAVNPNIVINIPETKGKWRIWDWDI